MYKRYIKRLLDILISLIALPAISVVLIIIAPIIYLTDKGPVFYNAHRVGQYGRLFKMYKLRSMYVDAPDIRLEDGSTYNGEDDPRVTPIGRFIRKTSIDELPQVLNILLGHMSLIGPRPDPPDWLDRYPEDIRVFLTVKPGITGYSQAYYRNSADGAEKMKHDAFYATHCTFWMDLKIFIKTIATVVLAENTYKNTENETKAIDEVSKLDKKERQGQLVKNCVREYGSEYDWDSNNEFWRSDDICRKMINSVQKYRSGRDALRAVAKACKDSYSRILMPALCCESMVAPFSAYGITPVFYRLNADYMADTEDVLRKLTSDSVLLYVPYFGVTPFDRQALQKIRMEYGKVLFLEDRTQDILRMRRDDFVPDVMIASIRKWVAIPDGGILWSRELRFEEGDSGKVFAELRKQAMQIKSVYLQSGDTKRKETFRKMLNDASEMLDDSAKPVAMTEESVRILEKLDMRKILRQRQANIEALKAALEPALKTGKLKAVTNHPEYSTLYYPVLTEHQALLQKYLAEQGIYCPVIWPVPKAAEGICAVADYTASHMLALPCDHRYTPQEMAYIGSEIVRICNEL